MPSNLCLLNNCKAYSLQGDLHFISLLVRMKLYIIDSDLYFHFEEGETEKESQIKSKLNGRKYMVMVRVEINEIGKNKEK